MIVGALGVVFGLISSFIVIRMAFSRLSFTGSVLGAFAIYSSSVSILGYLIFRLGFPIRPEFFSVFFFILLISEMAYVRKRGFALGTKRWIAYDTLIFLFCFLFYLYPSLPSLFPVGWEIDSAVHFRIIDNIYENQNLGGKYSFGFHLFVSLLSMSLDREPIRLLYPLVCVFFSFSVLACFKIAQGMTTRRDIYPFLAPFFVMTSIYPFELLMRGFYAAGFCIFLCLVFIMILKEFEGTRLQLFILGIMASGIFYTYIIWIHLVILSSIIVFLIQDIPLKNRVLQVGIFIVVFVVLSLDCALNFMGFVFTSAGSIIKMEGGTTVVTVTNLGILLVLLSSIGVLSSFGARKNKVESIFSFVLLVSIVVHYMGRYFLGFSYYYYAKYYFLFIYVASILSVEGFNWLQCALQKGHKKIPFSRHIATCLMIFILGFQAYDIGVYLETPRALYVNPPRDFFNSPPAITPEQYEVARWTKENLPEGELSFVADPPLSMWFYVVSGHSLKSEAPEKWQANAMDIKKWCSKAGEGEVLVILDLPKRDFDPDQRAFDKSLFLREEVEVGQTFVAQGTYIGKMELVMSRKGNPGDLTLSIFEGRKKIESVVMSKSLVHEGIWTPVEFILNSSVEEGKAYRFMLSSHGVDGENYYGFLYTEKNSYAEGTMLMTGTLFKNSDLFFRIGPAFLFAEDEIVYGDYSFKILYEAKDNYVLQFLGSKSAISQPTHILIAGGNPLFGVTPFKIFPNLGTTIV